MDKKSFSAEILKYWYFVEFMSQADFPRQEKSAKDECDKAKKGTPKESRLGFLKH